MRVLTHLAQQAPRETVLSLFFKLVCAADFLKCYICQRARACSQCTWDQQWIQLQFSSRVSKEQFGDEKEAKVSTNGDAW
jgi:hypothetical protein